MMFQIGDMAGDRGLGQTASVGCGDSQKTAELLEVEHHVVSIV